jgi:hypothetical protein
MITINKNLFEIEIINKVFSKDEEENQVKAKLKDAFQSRFSQTSVSTNKLSSIPNFYNLSQSNLEDSHITLNKDL